MVWIWPLLFGVGCGVSMRLASGRAACTLATHLVVVWALANAAWVSNMLWVLPVLDLGLGIVAIQIAWTTQARWVATLIDVIRIRLALHVLDGLTAHFFFIAYVHALNAAFAWMLFLVASTGGGHGSTTDRRDAWRRWLHSMGGLRAPTPTWEVTNGG